MCKGKIFIKILIPVDLFHYTSKQRKSLQLLNFTNRSFVLSKWLPLFDIGEREALFFWATFLRDFFRATFFEQFFSCNFFRAIFFSQLFSSNFSWYNLFLRNLCQRDYSSIIERRFSKGIYFITTEPIFDWHKNWVNYSVSIRKWLL